MRCEMNLNDGMPVIQCPEVENVEYLPEDDGYYCPKHTEEIREEIGAE